MPRRSLVVVSPRRCRPLSRAAQQLIAQIKDIDRRSAPSAIGVLNDIAGELRRALRRTEAGAGVTIRRLGQTGG